MPNRRVGRRRVPIRLVALSLREPRADGDVAAVGADEVEQAAQLLHGVLAVCVDPPAERVAALVGLVVARRDPGPEPAVLAERDDDRATGRRDGGSCVGRAVVDDEHVRVGQLRRSSSSTAGSASSSFQAGMKTTVSASAHVGD